MTRPEMGDLVMITNSSWTTSMYVMGFWCADHVINATILDEDQSRSLDPAWPCFQSMGDEITILSRLRDAVG